MRAGPADGKALAAWGCMPRSQTCAPSEILNLCHAEQVRVPPPAE